MPWPQARSPAIILRPRSRCHGLHKALTDPVRQLYSSFSFMMHLRGASCFQTGSDHDLQRSLATPPSNVAAVTQLCLARARQSFALPCTRSSITVSRFCSPHGPQCAPVLHRRLRRCPARHAVLWHAAIDATRWASMFGVCALVSSRCARDLSAAKLCWMLPVAGRFPCRQRLISLKCMRTAGLAVVYFSRCTGAWWRFAVPECLQSGTRYILDSQFLLGQYTTHAETGNALLAELSA
jgi:hypothetical protein